MRLHILFMSPCESIIESLLQIKKKKKALKIISDRFF